MVQSVYTIRQPASTSQVVSVVVSRHTYAVLRHFATKHPMIKYNAHEWMASGQGRVQSLSSSFLS
eukprot:m.79524 g.79524  ORF g.79524 m.79524 type:complete len:65 (-) comp16272_c0_seq1:1096-1290(-)